MNRGTSGWSQNPEQRLNQINQYTHCQTVSPSQIPTVSFDLGNEWDDFDDENLVHASETSFASSTANVKPQIQQSVENNMSGRVTSDSFKKRNSLWIDISRPPLL